MLSSNIKDQNNANTFNNYYKIKSINEENDLASDPDEIKSFKKLPKNKIYPKLLKLEEGKHYYHR